jgi:cathepsin A (carboxypeptidase C)
LNLEWSGKSDFNTVTDHDWEGNGLARTAKGLTFLQVYDAGHMVPADQPKVALDMLATFLALKSF